MQIKGRIFWIIAFVAAVFYLVPMAEEKLAFARTKPSLQEAAPNFSLSALTGSSIRLSDYKGKVVLVNFFASWCPPCNLEIPWFQKAYTSYRDKGFAVIGIALDDVSPSFVRKMGMTYPVVAASDRVISDYGNVSSIPVSFLVGKDGRIIKKVMGVYSEARMKSDIEKALSGRI